MNPYEEKLAQFVEDEVMYGAVKAILEAKFDLNKMDYRDETVTNEVLGQLARAGIEGRDLLALGFKELDTYKKSKAGESKGDVNPAV